MNIYKRVAVDSELWEIIMTSRKGDETAGDVLRRVFGLPRKERRPPGRPVKFPKKTSKKT